MIDRVTTIEELSDLLHIDTDKFYVRPSFAKYYYGTSTHGFDWNWMCKLGTEDDTFQARLTLNGVLDASYVRKNIARCIATQTNQKASSNEVSKGIKILNSYADYLVDKLHPYLIKLNK